MKLLLSPAHEDKSGRCTADSLGKSTLRRSPLSFLMHSGRAAGREGDKAGSGNAACFPVLQSNCSQLVC